MSDDESPEWSDYGDESELAEFLERCAQGDGAAEPPDPDAEEIGPAPIPPAAWNPRDTHGVFEVEWVEPEWLVPSLELGPGRPMGLAGPPGCGKNDTAQALALAVMSGRDAYERFRVARRGRVIHLTWDMGGRATALRYRQLAAGAGIGLNEIRDRLVLCSYPATTLTSPKALQEFAAVLQGFDLAILDNLRSATPGQDENSSTFAGYLEVFGRACAQVGCSGLYLHHTRKGGGGGGDSMRGTSAILAASGALWRIEGEKDAPRHVVHERQHDMSDGMKPDFWLVRQEPDSPEPYDTGEHPPIRLVARLEAPPTGAKRAGAREAVLKAIRSSPGIGKNEIVRAIGGSHDAVPEVLEALLRDGRIRRELDGQKHCFFPVGSADRS